MVAETLDPSFKTRPADQFSLAVWLSLVAHISLIVIFSVKAAFFPTETKIYENAVRVDLVALPDKVLPNQAVAPAPVAAPPVPQAAPPPAPTPKVETPVKKVEAPQPDAINLEKKNKKNETAAMKKLKELDAFDKIKSDLDKEKAEKQIKKAATVFKGNQISSGSELTGLSRMQYDSFVSEITQKIHANFFLPEWLAQKNLNAQALVRFDGSGNVVFKQIVKSSGNPSFDDMVLETIQRSSPLPAPPEKLAKLVANEGITVGFPE